ncbi:4-phosphoerythronate dehydrogenase PdxB [Porphyromonadaceae bacterium]
MIKVIADDKIPFLKGVLEPFAEVVYLPGSKTTPEVVHDADAILTRTRTHCNEALLKNSSVKLIATATIGYDHIDTAYCEGNDIRWINAPGCNSSSVQQYISAAIIALAKEKNLRLAEMTLGVIGVGNVGSKVAKAAAALGMRSLLNDPPRANAEGNDGFVELDYLLANSDIVTCHTPLTRSGKYATYHLADASFFSKMKTGAIFINSSRGEVVDSEALKQAFAEKKISEYILDVWEGEPDLDRELLNNAFIGTPHIAGYSNDGKANGTAACVHELQRFFGLDESLKNWYPSSIPHPPMATERTIDCVNKTDEELFYEAIYHTYPLFDDSLRLKHQPEAFEQQRGDYWIRREFPAFTLTLKGASIEQQGRLQQLGFNVHNL